MFIVRIVILPVICLVVFLFLPAQAQKEAYVWNFGYGARINFNSTTPA